MSNERVPVLKNDVNSYIEYVEYYINLMSKLDNLVKDNSINFYDINFALGNHLKILNVLTLEYSRKKYEYQQIERNFGMWWDIIFISEKNRVNDGLPHTKWASKTEIESSCRVTNNKDYLEKKQELDELELKVSFLARVIENWKSFNYTLSTLSDNLKSEYFSNLKTENS